MCFEDILMARNFIVFPTQNVLLLDKVRNKNLLIRVIK